MALDKRGFTDYQEVTPIGSPELDSGELSATEATGVDQTTPGVIINAADSFKMSAGIGFAGPSWTRALMRKLTDPDEEDQGELIQPNRANDLYPTEIPWEEPVREWHAKRSSENYIQAQERNLLLAEGGHTVIGFGGSVLGGMASDPLMIAGSSILSGVATTARNVGALTKLGNLYMDAKPILRNSDKFLGLLSRGKAFMTGAKGPQASLMEEAASLISGNMLVTATMLPFEEEIWKSQQQNLNASAVGFMLVFDSIAGGIHSIARYRAHYKNISMSSFLEVMDQKMNSLANGKKSLAEFTMIRADEGVHPLYMPNMYDLDQNYKHTTEIPSSTEPVTSVSRNQAVENRRSRTDTYTHEYGEHIHDNVGDFKFYGSYEGKLRFSGEGQLKVKAGSVVDRTTLRAEKSVEDSIIMGSDEAFGTGVALTGDPHTAIKYGALADSDSVSMSTYTIDPNAKLLDIDAPAKPELMGMVKQTMHEIFGKDLADEMFKSIEWGTVKDALKFMEDMTAILPESIAIERFKGRMREAYGIDGFYWKGGDATIPGKSGYSNVQLFNALGEGGLRTRVETQLPNSIFRNNNPEFKKQYKKFLETPESNVDFSPEAKKRLDDLDDEANAGKLKDGDKEVMDRTQTKLEELQNDRELHDIKQDMAEGKFEEAVNKTIENMKNPKTLRKVIDCYR